MHFLHTGDWQLGMTRHFLDDGAQARFTEARFEAVARMAQVARDHDCAFAVVSGDVFETNQVGSDTVRRALEALRAWTVPVFLLPGNHDPLDGAAVFTRRLFLDEKPDTVRVLDSVGPHAVPEAPGVELVALPWRSKRPSFDPVRTWRSLPPPTRPRILVAHGALDTLTPDDSAPTLLPLAALEADLAAGLLDYVALGDRHSLTLAGAASRVAYSGAPEPTAFREVDPGHCLVVEVGGGPPQAVSVGTWRFHQRDVDLAGAEDVKALRDALDALPNKSKTLLKLSLVGTLSLREGQALEDHLDWARDVFAGVARWERHTDLVLVPDDTDFTDLSLGGFADIAVARLREQAAGAGAEARTARDALGLLLRLDRRTA